MCRQVNTNLPLSGLSPQSKCERQAQIIRHAIELYIYNINLNKALFRK